MGTVKKTILGKFREVKPNTLFPGRENYTGPNTGWFAMLHHTVLFESTDGFTDGVRERIRYVGEHKPTREVKVRLANMMYVGNCPEIVTLQMLTEVKKAGYETHPDADSHANRLAMATRCTLNGAINNYMETIAPAVLAYVKKHNPEHAWRHDWRKPVYIGKIKGTH